MVVGASVREFSDPVLVTVVVSAASSEGIALAADSRTTERLGTGHRRVASDWAQKVFGAHERYGVATYGDAMIRRKTVRSLFEEWSASAKAPKSLQAFAEALGQFFQQELPMPRGKGSSRPASGWPLGFLVAGYDDDRVGRVLEVRVRPEDYRVVDTDSNTDKPSVLYRGQTSTIRRLIRGVDFDEIRNAGLQVPDDAMTQMAPLHYELIGPTTTQDAVDFAFFLIETTIAMQRFSDGTVVARQQGRLPVPGCGGPVQGLVIEPRGLRWVNRVEPHTPRSQREGVTGSD